MKTALYILAVVFFYISYDSYVQAGYHDTMAVFANQILSVQCLVGAAIIGAIQKKGRI